MNPESSVVRGHLRLSAILSIVFNMFYSRSSLILTESLVELDHRDGQGVALVGDRVISELGDPALRQAVCRTGVHQTMVETHAYDGCAVSFQLLH